MKHKNKIACIGAILLASTVTTNIAVAQVEYQDVYYGQGYTIVNRSPVTNNDLNQTINKKVDATTVFQGLQQVLNGTGWQLAGLAASDPSVERLYESPWPSNWTYYITDSLQNILQTIGGEGWQLVVDPVNRLVSFEVRKGYR